MSKRLKNAIIILVVVLATAGLAVGGYFLISSLSSTTIYTLKIVDKNGNAVKDTSVYLIAGNKNSFDISVEVQASNTNNGYYFTSSNKDVADVVQNNGSYAVEYYKTGSAVITAYSRATSSVYDSFNINVYSDFVADLIIDQKSNNLLTIYGDGNSVKKDYVATGVLNGENCNNLQLRVVDNYNKKVFDSISIDDSTKQVNISPKLVTTNSRETFTIQSYYVDAEGKEHVEKNFDYSIDVIGYRIEDIQLLFCQDYLFNGNVYLYLNTDWGSVSKDDVFMLDGEQLIDNVYITSDVSTLFFKIRVVYSNKTYADISTETLSNGSANGYFTTIGGTTRNMNYWSVSATPDIVISDNQSYDEIYFSYIDKVVDSRVEKRFGIFYLEKTDRPGSTYQNFVNKQLYKKIVQKDGTFYFEYIYWDTRFKRTDAITNANKQIIGFTNGDPDCETFYEELES